MKEEEEKKTYRRRSEQLTMTRLFKLLLFIAMILLAVLVYLSLRYIGEETSPPPFYSLEAPAYAEALFAEKNPVIIDIRQKDAYLASHIAGAIRGEKNTCSAYGVDLCTRAACPSSQTYFFYSQKGEDYHEIRYAISRTSSRGCWKDVYFLEDGFTGWVKAGLPVE